MSHDVAENLDPRIRRTRLQLRQALDKLMKNKKFDEISVQDIAQAAAVNRATFYDHYADKYALLECSVAGRFHELLTERSVQFDRTCASALQAMVLAVCDFLAAGPPLEPHMETAIVAVVRRTLLEGLKRHPPSKDVAPEIVAAAAGGAVYGAAREWAQTVDRCSPVEMARRVAVLVAPMLDLVPGTSSDTVIPNEETAAGCLD